MITTSLKYKMEIAQNVISGQKTLQQARELFRDDLGEFLNIYGTMKEVSDRMKELDQFANNQRFATITAYKMIVEQYKDAFDRVASIGDYVTKVQNLMKQRDKETDEDKAREIQEQIDWEITIGPRVKKTNTEDAYSSYINEIMHAVATYNAQQLNLSGQSEFILRKTKNVAVRKIKAQMVGLNDLLKANSFADICKKEALKQFLTENGFGGIYEQ